MTNSEFMKAVLDGKPLIVVEYRASKAERIQWRDKETKQVLKAVTLAHTVENSDGSIRVSERPPEDIDPDTYVPPFKKGEIVVLHLTSLQVQRGIVTATGSMVRLENDVQVSAGSAKSAAQVPVVK